MKKTEKITIFIEVVNVLIDIFFFDIKLNQKPAIFTERSPKF